MTGDSTSFAFNHGIYEHKSTQANYCDSIHNTVSTIVIA